MSHHDLDIAKILALSRLKASAEDQKKITESLVQILNWVSVMEEVNTDNIEPMLGALSEMPRRDDVILDGNIAKKILQNAPDQAFGMFGVPKVVE